MTSRPTRNLAIVFRGTEKLVVEDIGYPKFEDPMGRQHTKRSYYATMLRTSHPHLTDQPLSLHMI